MLYDLHVHSTASDGLLSVEQLIEKAIAIGLPGIAITDHDTIDGLESAIQYVREHEFEFKLVPGIELNTELKDQEVHILGYFIDYANNKLKQRLQEIRQSRYDRAEKMTNKLIHMGFDIDFQEVKGMAKGDLIARPHIAQALIAKGYVSSLKEAFAKYIGQGKPAYVSRYKFHPVEAIELVKAAGGIPVLAHPGLIKNQNTICEIIALGIEGIEVFYPEHSEGQTQKYIELSRRNGLIITGGSDFHGVGPEELRGRLGCCGVSPPIMQEICEYYHKKMLKINVGT